MSGRVVTLSSASPGPKVLAWAYQSKLKFLPVTFLAQDKHYKTSTSVFPHTLMVVKPIRKELSSDSFKFKNSFTINISLITTNVCLQKLIENVVRICFYTKNSKQLKLKTTWKEKQRALNGIYEKCEIKKVL